MSTPNLPMRTKNWDLTKKEYTRELKNAWLEVASDFVEEISDGKRDLIPLESERYDS